MGSNPAEVVNFLRVIKISSMPSFKDEVKQLVHVVRFHGMLKNSTSLKEIFHRQNP
jgi:hypothetical protein